MEKNLEKIFDFLHQVEGLKSVLRYNVTSSGRKESVAEHSWRLALMAFVVAKKLNLNVDIARAVEIAIIHDIPEVLTGDIDALEISDGKVSKEKKNQKEKAAIEKLKNILSPKTGRDIFNLWQEYEKCETREAKFIKALDKIETLTQLVESGYKTYDRPEFIANYADEAVRNFPELTEMLKIIKRKLKEEFKKGNIEWKEEYAKI